AVIVVIVGAVLSLTMLGGQTSAILSKVGASISMGTGSAGNPTDTTDTIDPSATGGQAGEIANAAATPPELLIIRTGSLELEVADLGSAVQAASARVSSVGGYISGSEESAEGEDARASVTYRIPADRWDEALSGIRGLATEVRHLQVETEAVTNQVVDLGARISNLRATEAALQRIMNSASSIPDVLKVQDELTRVRGEIEQLVAQKSQLEERAAFGTLTAVFRLPAAPAVEEVRRGWDPATDVDRATGTLIGIGQSATSAGIWLAIVVLPLGLAMLLAVIVAWRVTRRLGGRGGPLPDAS
ncbi:MAG TPA: DUF4349 domain-containing protein, partial [Candidatus Limnocylindrales bacterium]|nr:DUF4349 domain-containing protein [Candidatus Limnocylindrales bacterium]